MRLHLNHLPAALPAAYLLLAVILMGSSCVRFKRVGLSQVSLLEQGPDQSIVPSTQQPAGRAPQGGVAGLSDNTGATETLQLFAESNTLGWGLEPTKCKDFTLAEGTAHTGSKALHLVWDKQPDCPFLGMGIPLAGWQPYNLSPLLGKGAIRFYIQSVKADAAFSVTLGLADMRDHAHYVAVGPEHIRLSKGSTFSEVVVPLSAFNLADGEVRADSAKQLTFGMEGSGDFYLDDVALVTYAGIMPTSPAIAKAGQERALPQVVFDDDFPMAWGIADAPCKQMGITQEGLNGSKAIRWTWDKKLDCPWVGWGGSWNQNQPLNLAPQFEHAALTFNIKSLLPPAEQVGITIGLEDMAGKTAFIGLDLRHIADDVYGKDWQQVRVPLAQFAPESAGLDMATMKQLIFSGEGKGAVLIDDISISSFTGPADNPFHKKEYSESDAPVITEDRATTEGTFIGSYALRPPPVVARLFEQQTGKKPASVMWYQDWTTQPNVDEIKAMLKANYLPHIVWEATIWDNKNHTLNLTTILAGQYDAYIDTYAQNLQKVGGPVQVRLFHEFNGNWYPWALALNGQDADRFIKAFRYVVARCRKAGATNVQWVWCYNNVSVPNQLWNDPLRCYPGDEYVDWLSVDVYNWGQHALPNVPVGWDTFTDLVAPEYLKMARLAPDKPLQIGEFASNEAGGDKAAWLRSMNTDMKQLYPRIKSYNYFNINKETDWRINSSKATQGAFREVMRDPNNRSSGMGLAAVPKGFKADFPDTTDLAATLTALAERTREAAGKRSAARAKQAAAAKTATATRATKPPVLDGKITQGEWPRTPIKIGTSTCYMQYDAQNLYLACRVADTDPLQNKQEPALFYSADALEIAISTDTKADPTREAYLSTDHHLALSANATPATFSWRTNALLPTAEAKSALCPGGYIVEWRIPTAALGGMALQPGTNYGFEMAVDEGTASTRRTQTRWNSATEGFHEQPALWGRLILQ